MSITIMGESCRSVKTLPVAFFSPAPTPAPIPLAILSGPASSLFLRYRKYIASFPAISSWHRSLQLRTSAAGPAAYSAR